MTETELLERILGIKEKSNYSKNILLFILIITLIYITVITYNLNTGQNQQINIRDFLTSIKEDGLLQTNYKKNPTPFHNSLSQLPIYFEPNLGQMADQVKFLAHGPSYSFFLTQSEAVFTLYPEKNLDKCHFHPCLTKKSKSIRIGASEIPHQSTTVHMRFEGASHNSAPELEGLERLPGISNYFIGNKPDKWRTHIPHFRQVRYRDIYPGIDLVFYGNGQELEYDFILTPGANPDAIRIAFDGVEGLHITDNGDLVLQIAGDKIIQRAPRIYQNIQGQRREVVGHYTLLPEDKTVALSKKIVNFNTHKTNKVGFQVAQYAPDSPLIIDPALVYSSCLGGSKKTSGWGIAVDDDGNSYVTGWTESPDFPTINTYQQYLHGKKDAFILKLDPSGTEIVYFTYIGGSDEEAGKGIAVDNLGNAYITGETWSSDFPTMNAYQRYAGGDKDAFILKLNPSGTALVYSTYLGGSSWDKGKGIAVDSDGNAYITGSTKSNNFPLINALQPHRMGGMDAFIIKLDANGAIPFYSTYIGGSGHDKAKGIAIDSSGNVYIAGWTDSTDFPTINPFQRYSGGGKDAFISKIDVSGTALAYSTYIGGSGWERAKAIAVDSDGNAYLTGWTESPDFPKKNPIQNYLGDKRDVFIFKLNTSGTDLIYSTYLGGNRLDKAKGIAVDLDGNAYVTGGTASLDFPIVDAFQQHNGGDVDAFILKVNPIGTKLDYSTYLGGSGEDWARAIALDKSGNVYITGDTTSSNFPITNNSVPTHHNKLDTFITKISPKKN